MSKSKNKTGYSIAIFLTLVLVGAVASAKAEIVDVTISANVSPFGCTLFGQTEASPATVSFRLDTSAPIFIPAGTQIGPDANDLIFTDLYGYQKNALSAISASYGNKTWDADDVSDGPLAGYAPNPEATVWFNGPVTAGGTAIFTIGFYDSDGSLVLAPLLCGLNEWGGGCGLPDSMKIFEMMGSCDGIGGPLQVDVVSISPTSLNFAQVIVGSSSTKTVTVSNTGDGNLTIGTIAISGTNADQFNIPAANDHCSNQTVLPSSSCTVDVKFSPTLTGNMNATLNIPSNDPDTPTANVPLTGNGAKVVVTSPNGGETLESGKVWMFIRWDTSPTINPVKVKDTYLYYSFDGGATWKFLAISTGNLGWYPWQAPHVSKTKSRCKVKVVLKNATGNIVAKDVSDKVFTIKP